MKRFAKETISENLEKDMCYHEFLDLTCSKKKYLISGTGYDANVVKRRLHERSPCIASTCIRMCVKRGDLSQAQQMFHELRVRDEISWSALIASYVRQGEGHEALKCFEKMRKEGFSPDVIAFISILKACSLTKSLDKGKQIHDEISIRGLLGNNIALGNSLVDMYGKCGALAKAQQVFDELPGRDVISWSILIGGYSQHGLGHEALNAFEQMQKEGLSPDIITFTSILKVCGSIKCIETGKRIHDDIASKGLLEKDIILGNALIGMYVKCGMLKIAHKLLLEIPNRDVVSWNTLIAGYSQQFQGHEALRCFEMMQNEGISPNLVTFSCTLKACTSIKAVEKGIKIHNDIVNKKLLIKDIVLGNGLIHMYAKCGLVAKAFQVLYELPIRNVISWNALIVGCDLQEHWVEALRCFAQMQTEGYLPDMVTLVYVLKSCSNSGAIDEGMKIHIESINRGLLQKNIIIGNALVHMYSKCGMPLKAEEVFDRLVVRNEATFNALIAGYAQQEQFHEALNCFERMQSEGLSPDAVTFTCILKACGTAGAIEKGEEIHNDVLIRCLLETDVLVGNALVDMYAKCGVLVKAQEVHDELPVRDVVSWNALIAGYAEQGRFHEALAYFEHMQNEGISPDAVTFTCILKISGSIGEIDLGKRIHYEVVSRCLLDKNIVLGNALVDMYAKCHASAKAHKVLSELPIRNLASWSALIVGYTLEGRGDDALKCFEKMQSEGFSPDGINFTCILKACGSIGAIVKGIKIHIEIVRADLLDKDTELGSALVDMYSKCGILSKAQEVLSRLTLRDVVSWNALISGYVQWGQCHKAINCFIQMQREGFCPDVVTYSSILKACGIIRSINTGKQVHEEIQRNGILIRDVTLVNVLIEMYAKCGMPAIAEQILYQHPFWDRSSWNALIAAYVQEEQGHEALNCFEQMQIEGFSPDEITFVCILKACAIVGAVDKGKEIHAEIVDRCLLCRNVVLGTALVDMYSKCGMLAKAVRIHDELRDKDTVSWNALIAGYAHHGQGYEALNCFKQMQSEGFSPDSITLLCMLTACSHSGLVEESHIYFRSITRNYEVTPNAEINSCMAAILGRAGEVDALMSMIQKMPSSDPVIWLVLLSMCKKWGNVKLGKFAFDHVIQLDTDCSIAFV